MSEVRYILLESAIGYTLLERKASDEIGSKLADVQTSVLEFQRFSKIMSLTAFLPFNTAEQALENINDIAEGVLNPLLKDFLTTYLPIKSGKKAKYALGVAEHKLGGMIQEDVTVPCVCNEMTAELIRGARLHLKSFVSKLKEGDAERAQLGLAHSFSRCKVRARMGTHPTSRHPPIPPDPTPPPKSTAHHE